MKIVKNKRNKKWFVNEKIKILQHPATNQASKIKHLLFKGLNKIKNLHKHPKLASYFLQLSFAIS